MRIAVGTVHRALGSIRRRASGPRRSARVFIVSSSTSGLSTPPLSLNVRKPQRSRNLAAISAIAEGVRTSPHSSMGAARGADAMRVGEDRRVVGRVAVEQVCRELGRGRGPARPADRRAGGRWPCRRGRGRRSRSRHRLRARARAARGRSRDRRRRRGRRSPPRDRSRARVFPSPPAVSPMPTRPASVATSTTLRRKYGPWQPLAARIGGSGRAIGVTFRPVIFSGGFGSAAIARPALRGRPRAARFRRGFLSRPRVSSHGEPEPIATVQVHGREPHPSTRVVVPRGQPSLAPHSITTARADESLGPPGGLPGSSSTSSMITSPGPSRSEAAAREVDAHPGGGRRRTARRCSSGGRRHY